MDRLKIVRGPVRASLTKTVKEVEDELVKENPDPVLLRMKSLKIDDLLKRLEELDGQILDQLLDDGCSEDKYEEECTAIEERRDKAREIKVKMEFFSTPRPSSPANSSSWYNSVPSESGKKKSYKLPKTQIKKFGGEITEWLSWWAQFAKINDDDELHDSDKFQYLVQAMTPGTKAEELVKIYPQTEDNYPKVIRALKERFGKEKILKRVYVRELLKLIIKNSREHVKITEVFDQLEGHLKALESLGITPDQMDIILYPMVESCLPEEVLVAWQRSAHYGRDGKGENPPRTEFDYMLEFVKREVENESQRALVQSGFGINPTEDNSKSRDSKKKKSSEQHNPITAATLYANESKSQRCLFCDKSNHQSQDCYKGLKMTIEERSKKAKEANVCFNCLKKGHNAKFCKSSITCSDCGRNHCKMMCRQPRDPTQEVTEGVKAMLASHPEGKTIVIRGTMQANVRGPNNKFQRVRVLIDSGSDISYINSKLATDLKLKELRKQMFQTQVFGGGVEILERTEFQVHLQGINGGEEKLNMFSETNICGNCDPVPYGPWVKELMKRKVFLTDLTEESGPIDLLIGCNQLGKLLTGKMVKIGPTITATETTVGWYLNGEVPAEKNKSLAARSIALLNKNQELSALWDLEALGIKDTADKVSQEEHDDMVKEDFQRKLKRSEDGRYVVQLPWIAESLPLPHNRNIAMKHLERATTKLIAKDELQNYGNIFKSWELEGIIEVQGRMGDEPDGHFLTHRPVFKPESLTTPVRPVYNGSLVIGNQPSLNQCLEKGPNLLELILEILLRFRKKKVGVISDIRKAFQMVEVDPQDRKFQRFLWWDDYEKKIVKVYQHCRVVFGLNCSPFILAAVLEAHLKDVPEEEKATSQELLRSLYVDNCVNSFATVEELYKFKNQSIEILARAKMDLRQWESNTDENMELVVTSVLGYKWDKQKDELFCDIPIKDWCDEELNSKVTKRSVL